jgi:hypothetical protein
MARKLRLEQGPEGAPNFCFGLYDADTGECAVFVQSDWDYPGLASSFGFVPCECGRTDGTIDCPHKRASDMIAAAFDFLAEHDGEVIESADY